jgi:diacylglycerol kinase
MSHQPRIPPPELPRPRAEEPPPIVARRRIDRRMGSLVRAFGYAFAGVWYLLRTQRNAQIHCLVAGCAMALGAALRIARWEWLALILTIALVLAAEGLNTAIEAAVDVATTRHHPLAKVAKDVAAGTVLICAIASVAVGCVVFIPHLIALYLRLFL